MKHFSIGIKQENGVVSMIVTMLLMVILSLIVIGFAKLTLREQRQVLDRQLSSQAFYAAESGINDAVAAIKAGQYPNGKPNCGADGILDTPNLDATGIVSYTCVTIEPAPASLAYPNIPTDNSVIIPLKSASAATPITRLVLSWEAATPPDPNNLIFSGCPAQGNFPNDTTDCDAGMLRVDLVRASAASSRNNLLNNTLTAFLQPLNSGGSSQTLTNTNQGTRCNTAVTATTPYPCVVEIRGLNSREYALRVRSIYHANKLNIVAYNGATPIGIVGTQTIVDSTGKANDVLRRIQIRVDLTTTQLAPPSFAIQSHESICKRFYAAPGLAPTLDGAAVGEDSCKLTTN